MIGPQLPVAHCRPGNTSHHAPLEWRHLDCWYVHCKDCERYKAGSGLTPWEAIEEFAHIHCDIEPEELIGGGGDGVEYIWCEVCQSSWQCGCP